MGDVPSKNFTFYFLQQKYLKRKYFYIRYLLILVKNCCKKNASKSYFNKTATKVSLTIFAFNKY